MQLSVSKVSCPLVALTVAILMPACGELAPRAVDRTSPEHWIQVEGMGPDEPVINLESVDGSGTGPQSGNPASPVDENNPAGSTANTEGSDSTDSPDETNNQAPAPGELCAPCQSSEDCGGATDFCLQNSETGELFCGQSCSSGTCPAGFSCQALLALNQLVYQCIPDSETCGGGAPPPSPDVDTGDDVGTEPGDCGNVFESQVLELVNQERANNGLAPLACDLTAGQVARAYSQYMCDEGFFDHTGLDGSTPVSRLQAGGAVFVGAGENIAAGQPSPAAVMQGWMQSPGHRSNILSSMWTHLGVGYAKCGAYNTRWTQDFLRK